MAKLLNRLLGDCSVNWDKYITHEFGKKIANNKLDIENFNKYIIQDYYYLFIYAKSFMSLGFKARSFDEIEFVSDSLLSIITECKELKSINNNLDIDNIIINKSCLKYKNYLEMIIKDGDFLDILISIAPCFIGYYELAIQLKKSKDIRKEYSLWIDKCSSKEYKKSVDNIIDRINNFSNISDAKYKKLLKIFNDITILEYEFFEENL